MAEHVLRNIVRIVPGPTRVAVSHIQDKGSICQDAASTVDCGGSKRKRCQACSPSKDISACYSFQ